MAIVIKLPFNFIKKLYPTLQLHSTKTMTLFAFSHFQKKNNFKDANKILVTTLAGQIHDSIDKKSKYFRLQKA
jgi:hypothetical protein